MRVGDLLARSSKVAVSAWMRVSPKPTIVSGRQAMTSDRLSAGRRVASIDPEHGERCVHRALEHGHQVRLPLISTRGRVQIGEVPLHVQHHPAGELLITACLA